MRILKAQFKICTRQPFGAPAVLLGLDMDLHVSRIQIWPLDVAVGLGALVSSIPSGDDAGLWGGQQCFFKGLTFGNGKIAFAVQEQ